MHASKRRTYAKESGGIYARRGKLRERAGEREVPGERVASQEQECVGGERKERASSEKEYEKGEADSKKGVVVVSVGKQRQGSKLANKLTS